MPRKASAAASTAQRDEEFDPSKYATTRLMAHIVQKATQVGSLAGVPLVAALALRSRLVTGAAPLTAPAALNTMALTAAVRVRWEGGAAESCWCDSHPPCRCGSWWAPQQVGTVTLTTLGGYKVSGLDQDGVQDRVYRLHFNDSQNRCDRYANGCALIGAGVASAVQGPRPGAVVGGMAAGTAMGVLVHFFSATKKRE